jgi:DNA-binding LacI/PurR family transcriptional regulator
MTISSIDSVLSVDMASENAPAPRPPRSPGPARRPTIADIARSAGVSKSAVSYALNGQSGISAATAERILSVANELGWRPNRAARALRAATAGACGVVLAGRPSVLPFGPYFSDLFSGIEAELSARGIALMLQMVDDTAGEMTVLGNWWAERRVDGVILVNLKSADPRIPFLEDLGMPAVVVGGPSGTGRLPYSASDDAGGMQEVIRYLVAIGHRRIARVAGPDDLLHTVQRTSAFAAELQQAGVNGETIETDYTSSAGAWATRRLLSASQAPTAVVYDSDAMAVGGLGVAHEMGIPVPGRLSLVSFDDSPLCQLVHPSITALSRDLADRGAGAARILTDIVAGKASRSVIAPAARLTPRASTAAPGTAS